MAIGVGFPRGAGNRFAVDPICFAAEEIQQATIKTQLADNRWQRVVQPGTGGEETRQRGRLKYSKKRFVFLLLLLCG